MKKGLKTLVSKIYYEIKRREFELDEMAFRMTLGKSPHAYDKSTPQHVRAALMLEDKNIFMKKGDSVVFVKCTPFTYKQPNGDIIEKVNVKPLQLATKEDISIEKYHEMLRSTFEQILDPLGVDFDSAIGVTRLEQFM